MKILKTICAIILSFTFSQTFGQFESKAVISAVIEHDRNINERNIIVCEFLENLNDTTWTNLLKNHYGGFQIEELKYLNFGDLNVRLISKSSLLELQNITKKLNDCKSSENEYFSKLYQELIHDLFDRNLCIFYKVIFSKNKLFAIVKYRVESGSNAFGHEEFLATYFVEKLSGVWKVKQILETETK